MIGCQADPVLRFSPALTLSIHDPKTRFQVLTTESPITIHIPWQGAEGMLGAGDDPAAANAVLYESPAWASFRRQRAHQETDQEMEEVEPSQ